jgi:hypothetical protein
MNAPLLDLNAHQQPLRNELLAALEQVLDMKNFMLSVREIAQGTYTVTQQCREGDLILVREQP